VSVPIQLSFDELDTPLHDTTFVVVDLETTGGSPDTEAITEIGAVKIRGGEVIAEFATLVDPGRSIPPYIVELTGITTAMLIGAPRIDRVLPSFLEFARGWSSSHTTPVSTLLSSGRPRHAWTSPGPSSRCSARSNSPGEYSPATRHPR
jgi:hypothetical protein